MNGGVVFKTLGYGPVIQVVSILIMVVLLLLNGRLLLGEAALVITSATVVLLVFHLVHYVAFDYSSYWSLQVLNFISLIFFGVLVTNQFIDRNSAFILRLSFVLKMIVVHGIISCLVMSVMPEGNLMFTAADGKSQYMGHFYVFFAREHVNYYGVLESVKSSVLGYKLHRAHGVFWEPGVFAYFINLYVFINLFVLKKFKVMSHALLALVLAWSTTGFTVFLLLLAVYAFENRSVRNKQVWKVFVFGGIGCVMLLPLVWENVNNKLSGDNVGSAAQRVADSYGVYSVFKNNAVMGIGVDFQNLLAEIEKVTIDLSFAGAQMESIGKDSVRLSNSLMLGFLYFGAFGGAGLCYFLFRQTVIPHKRGLFFLINVLSVSAVPLLFLGFHFALVISGFRRSLINK